MRRLSTIRCNLSISFSFAVQAYSKKSEHGSAWKGERLLTTGKGATHRSVDAVDQEIYDTNRLHGG